MERRARRRRKEKPARASLRPVVRARVTSLYTLCCCSELTSSDTAPFGFDDDPVESCFTASIPSLHNGFFKYIVARVQRIRVREKDQIEYNFEDESGLSSLAASVLSSSSSNFPLHFHSLFLPF